MRWKRVLVIGAIVAVAAGVAAGGTLLLTYHEATKLDRSNPEVVLIRYLDATFERKDQAMASLFTCAKPAALAPLNSYRDELVVREKAFGVTILVTSGRMTQTGRTIQTDLHVVANKNGAVESESSNPWLFTMVDEDGWRVCGAERLVVPSASPSAPGPSASAVPSP